MSEKLRICKACGQEIAKDAKACPHCGAKNRKSIFKKWWFWVAIVVFIGVVGAAGGESDNGGTTGTEVGNNNPSATVGGIASAFDGDIGIVATAEIGNNIINFPELEITITNTSEKEIAAIKFYAVPYDVYGEEIKGWTTQRELYTDTPIAAGQTTKASFQLIEQSVKTVKLYVYSVYFADGTEWGDKDANSTKILKHAPTIEVEIKQ